LYIVDPRLATVALALGRPPLPKNIPELIRGMDREDQPAAELKPKSE
jgi:hypothetical protein